MSKVAIVTDSTSCMPPELLKEYDIRVVPVGMVMNGRVYRDMVDITAAEFWKIFPDIKEQPTTTAGNPGDFVTVFGELAKATDNIVCILVSKALTATFESAYLARKLVKADHPDVNIHIIDSRTSAGALGFIVLEAAKTARAGKPVGEVLKVVDDMTSRVIYVAALDTLKYLINIGRAPKNANIGEMLNVKPIIGFVDDGGLIEVVGRVGGKEKALNKMVDMVKKYVDIKNPLHVIVHYSNRPEEGEQLKQLVASRYKCAELLFTEYTPVMCSATGPMVGMGFYT
ncbi:MAG: DegV family protein [Chloroflexota bacterium]